MVEVRHVSRVVLQVPLAQMADLLHAVPQQAAERGLKTAWGGRLSVWYPGNAPIGHKLQVNSPEEQERLGCYGSKVPYHVGCTLSFCTSTSRLRLTPDLLRMRVLCCADLLLPGHHHCRQAEPGR